MQERTDNTALRVAVQAGREAEIVEMPNQQTSGSAAD